MQSFVLLLLNAYSTFPNSLIQTQTKENDTFQNINLKKVPDLLIMAYENESIKQSGLKIYMNKHASPSLECNSSHKIIKKGCFMTKS